MNCPDKKRKISHVDWMIKGSDFPLKHHINVGIESYIVYCTVGNVGIESYVGYGEVSNVGIKSQDRTYSFDDT